MIPNPFMPAMFVLFENGSVLLFASSRKKALVRLLANYERGAAMIKHSVPAKMPETLHFINEVVTETGAAWNRLSDEHNKADFNETYEVEILYVNLNHLFQKVNSFLS